jgi:hypothetical protein
MIQNRSQVDGRFIALNDPRRADQSRRPEEHRNFYPTKLLLGRKSHQINADEEELWPFFRLLWWLHPYQLTKEETTRGPLLVKRSHPLCLAIKKSISRHSDRTMMDEEMCNMPPITSDTGSRLSQLRRAQRLERGQPRFRVGLYPRYKDFSFQNRSSILAAGDR